MNRWEMEKKIAIRAIKDPDFKRKLLSNPKEAIKEFFKGEKDRSTIDLLNVKVYEEKKNEWIFSIPHVAERQQLSDTELEKLAAGAPLTCLEQNPGRFEQNPGPGKRHRES